MCFESVNSKCLTSLRAGKSFIFLLQPLFAVNSLSWNVRAQWREKRASRDEIKTFDSMTTTRDFSASIAFTQINMIFFSFLHRIVTHIFPLINFEFSRSLFHSILHCSKFEKNQTSEKSDEFKKKILRLFNDVEHDDRHANDGVNIF